MRVTLAHSNGFRLQTEVDDTSYRYETIMGEQSLTLHFLLGEFVEIPLGATCAFEGQTFTLLRAENVVMQHTRHYKYTVTLEGEAARCRMYRLRNMEDGRLKFAMTARPDEFAALIARNLNAREGSWKPGLCLDAPEKLVTFNHNSIFDALGLIAQAFDTEWEIVDKQVRIRRVKYNREAPLELAYGKGRGLLPGVGRTSMEKEAPIGTLFVQGGNRNIDRNAYGAETLHLPTQQKDFTFAFDGARFEWEDGFTPSSQRGYTIGDGGRSLYVTSPSERAIAEDSLDCSEIYPHRVGAVSRVEAVDAAKGFYDFEDAAIPDRLRYNECFTEEKATVVFQSGMLAGREFEIAEYVPKTKRF